MTKKEKGPGKSTELAHHSRNKRVLKGLGNHLGRARGRGSEAEVGDRGQGQGGRGSG